MGLFHRENIRIRLEYFRVIHVYILAITVITKSLVRVDKSPGSVTTDDEIILAGLVIYHVWP